MPATLIKFTHKTAARLFLRQNSLQHAKKSSLYKIENSYYLLVATDKVVMDSRLPYECARGNGKANWDNREVAIVINRSPSEEVVLAWASSELEQTLKFIEFETTSMPQANAYNSDYYLGRIIVHNNVEIIRTFEALFDVMAIVNYTFDSFSDGGQYNSQENTLNYIIKQVHAGAGIIDLGVESTRPNARSLTWVEEVEILKSILPQVLDLKQKYGFSLSIDTYHNETVKWLLEENIAFDIINDVSGNIEVELVKEIVVQDKKYIAMHSLSIPTDSKHLIPLEENPLDVIQSFFDKKIEQFKDNGISLAQIVSNIIFDPGIGFGKNAVQSWYILNNIAKINVHGAELLLGHSRKSFLNHITNKAFKERDLDTAFIAVQTANFFDVIRIHDTITAMNNYILSTQLHNIS